MSRHGDKPLVEVVLMSSLSAGLSTIATQPFEVLKTRLQAQPILKSYVSIAFLFNSLILRRQSSLGLLPTVVKLWSEAPVSSQASSPFSQRIRVFWAGTVPSIWRCVPGICAYFVTLNALERRMPRWVFLAAIWSPPTLTTYPLCLRLIEPAPRL